LGTLEDVKFRILFWESICFVYEQFKRRESIHAVSRVCTPRQSMLPAMELDWRVTPMSSSEILVMHTNEELKETLFHDFDMTYCSVVECRTGWKSGRGSYHDAGMCECRFIAEAAPKNCDLLKDSLMSRTPNEPPDLSYMFLKNSQCAKMNEQLLSRLYGEDVVGILLTDW